MSVSRALSDKGGGDATEERDIDWEKNESLSFGFNIHVKQEPVSKISSKQKLAELRDPVAPSPSAPSVTMTTTAREKVKRPAAADTKINNTSTAMPTSSQIPPNIKLDELAVVKYLVHQIKLNKTEISECKQMLQSQADDRGIERKNIDACFANVTLISDRRMACLYMKLDQRLKTIEGKISTLEQRTSFEDQAIINRMEKHLAELPADVRASPVSNDILEAQKREHKSQLEVMERSLVSQAQLFNELASLYKERDKEVFNHRQEVSSLLQSIREDQAGVNKLSERISQLESQVSKLPPYVWKSFEGSEPKQPSHTSVAQIPLNIQQLPLSRDSWINTPSQDAQEFIPAVPNKTTDAASNHVINPQPANVRGTHLEPWQNPLSFGFFEEAQYGHAAGKQQMVQTNHQYQQHAFALKKAMQPHVSSYKPGNHQQIMLTDTSPGFMNPQQTIFVNKPFLQSVPSAGIAYHYGPADINGMQIPNKNMRPNTGQPTQAPCKTTVTPGKASRASADGPQTLERVNKVPSMKHGKNSDAHQYAQSEFDLSKVFPSAYNQPKAKPAGKETKDEKIKDGNVIEVQTESARSKNISETKGSAQNQLDNNPTECWSPVRQTKGSNIESDIMTTTKPNFPPASAPKLTLSDVEGEKSHHIAKINQHHAQIEMMEISMGCISNNSTNHSSNLPHLSNPPREDNTQMNIMVSDSNMSLADNTKFRSPVRLQNQPGKPMQLSPHMLASVNDFKSYNFCICPNNDMSNCSCEHKKGLRERRGQTTKQKLNSIDPCSEPNYTGGIQNKEQLMSDNNQQTAELPIGSLQHQSDRGPRGKKVGLPPRLLNQKMKNHSTPPPPPQTQKPHWQP